MKTILKYLIIVILFIAGVSYVAKKVENTFYKITNEVGVGEKKKIESVSLKEEVKGSTKLVIKKATDKKTIDSVKSFTKDVLK